MKPLHFKLWLSPDKDEPSFVRIELEEDLTEEEGKELTARLRRIRNQDLITMSWSGDQKTVDIMSLHRQPERETLISFRKVILELFGEDTLDKGFVPFELETGKPVPLEELRRSA